MVGASHPDNAVVCHRPNPALAKAGADVGLVPWLPDCRFRRFCSSTVAASPRRDGWWRVVIARCAVPGSDGPACGARAPDGHGGIRTLVSAKRFDDFDPEWRRLRRAIGFFLACLTVSVALFVIGLYH